MLTRLVLTLPHDRIEFEPGIPAERARQEAEVVAGRAGERQHFAFSSRGTDQHRPRVVLDDRFAVCGFDLGRVDGGDGRFGRHRDHLLNRRSIGRGRERARFEQTSVGQNAQLKRRPAVAAADGRDAQIDRRLIDARIARRESLDFAIGRTVGRPDADREHRSAGDVCVGAPCGRAVRNQHDARHAPAAVALADAVDRFGQVAPPGAGPQVARLRGGPGIPDRVHLGGERSGQRRREVALEDLGGARQPGGAVRIRNPHAARHVHEHGHDEIAIGHGRQQDDRAAQKHDDQRERERAQRRQGPTLRTGKRDQRPAVRPERDRGHRDRRQARRPPGDWSCEVHQKEFGIRNLELGMRARGTNSKFLIPNSKLLIPVFSGRRAT